VPTLRIEHVSVDVTVNTLPRDQLVLADIISTKSISLFSLTKSKFLNKELYDSNYLHN
jgi:hypothetical protein